MKAQITVILLAISMSCFSQVKFVVNTKQEARITADSIAYNAPKQYRFISQCFVDGSFAYRIRYVNTTDTTMHLNVFFSKSHTVELYKFNMATGCYNDLFPAWKKFINPTAKINDCKGQLNEATKDTFRFHLREYSDIWQIIML